MKTMCLWTSKRHGPPGPQSWGVRTRYAQGGESGRRRGMALLMVLLLLSLTLGLSYAAMRSMSTAGMIQRNSDRRGSARQAAIVGLNMALKKMRLNSWTGVDTSLSGSLSTSDSFLVTYTTGDPRLGSNDADQPYRVTVLSTGYSTDSQQPQAVAIYRARAVVRLIPRKLPDEPSEWITMTGDPSDLTKKGFTVYQWTAGNFAWDPPGRIEGPVRMQANFALTTGYTDTWAGTPRNQYLSDLNAMRLAGRGDYRPFSSESTPQIRLQYSIQAWDTRTLLNNNLAVSTVDTAPSAVTGMTFPCTFPTYRIYPGGKVYNVPVLPSTIQSAVYQPDPATNPAGLYFRTGPLTISDNASITGTVFTAAGSGSQITISGDGVSISPANLPPLQGTTVPVQLPVAVVSDKIVFSSGANAMITGLVTTSSSYEILPARDTSITVTHKGKLIARDVLFDPRTDWSAADGWWSTLYSLFVSQKNDVYGKKYFPEYLAYRGLDSTPRVVIKPDTNTVRYHWHNPQNTIYVANPADGGLCWDLLDWAENL
jgi:hypothetical protein